MIADVRAGKPAIEPFMFLGVSDSAQDQLRCSQTWVHDQCPPSASGVWTGKRYRHDRIRLAYVSSDFHAHPLGYLMAALFEQHDRNRFETIASVVGPRRPESDALAPESTPSSDSSMSGNEATAKWCN